jgi:multimeric flavodoxin WrbA
MEKNILILKSSPRYTGNSAALADRLAEGARSIGAITRSFDLHKMNILPCDNCNGCQETGQCIIQDDMQSIYPELNKADAIVLAGPIYWFNINAQMKLCIDRWFCYQNVQWGNFKEKDAGIILTYGDPYLTSSGGSDEIKTLENLFAYLHMDILGIVHGSVDGLNDAKNNPELMDEAFNLGVKLGTIEI